MNTDLELMTPKETAEYLGFHVVSIYRMIKKKQIPAIRIGSQHRVSKKMINEAFWSQLKREEKD